MRKLLAFIFSLFLVTSLPASAETYIDLGLGGVGVDGYDSIDTDLGGAAQFALGKKARFPNLGQSGFRVEALARVHESDLKEMDNTTVRAAQFLGRGFFDFEVGPAIFSAGGGIGYSFNALRVEPTDGFAMQYEDDAPIWEAAGQVTFPINSRVAIGAEYFHNETFGLEGKELVTDGGMARLKIRLN